MNVLMVGLGSIAGKHIEVLTELDPAVCIWALRSRNGARDLDGVTNIYSLSELPVKPDFVIISNPTAHHLDTLQECLPLGVPLMVEKPLTDKAGLQRLESCIAQVKQKKIQTYVAFNLRFHAAIHFLKENISERRINEVNIYCGSYLPDWRPGQDFRVSYSADPHRGGGVHLDLIHEIDYCYWLFGKPVESRSLKTNHSSLSIQSIDYASFHLRYKAFSANIILNYYRRDPRRQIEIVFEDGTWTTDLLRCETWDQSGNLIFKKDDYHILHTYKAQMEYFLAHITSKKAMMNSISDTVEVLKICLTDE